MRTKKYFQDCFDGRAMLGKSEKTKGYKVCFTSESIQHGCMYDIDDLKDLINNGKLILEFPYTIDYLIIHQSSTDVILKEFTDIKFNSVNIVDCRTNIQVDKSIDNLNFTINDKILRKLNSRAVNYFLGLDKEICVQEKIVRLLESIDILCHESNQLNHLECNGVDNWGDYSVIDYDGENMSVTPS